VTIAIALAHTYNLWVELKKGYFNQGKKKRSMSAFFISAKLC